MFDTGDQDVSCPKCFFAHSILPGFVDHGQPSQKRKPFSTIQQHIFNHTLDLLLPTEACQPYLESLGDKASLQYVKFYMKPSEIIEGDFFNEHIKSGNVLMLSEGRSGLDNVFSLHEGVLRVEIDKATYERLGLSGTLIATQGRKHVKARYAIEINLRLPSMVRGKRGFERIVWAFKNVLNSRVAWLFYNLKGANDGTGPIAIHQPIVSKAEPKAEALGEIKIPTLPEEVEPNDQDTPIELLEWLGLALIGSPRVQKGGQIDQYLSRYQVPSAGVETERATEVKNWTRIRWHGFIPATFVQSIVIAAMKAEGEHWFALSNSSFDGKTHTFLQHRQHTFTWDFES